MTNMAIGLRAVLLLTSFCGLCAGARRSFRLSRFVAPLVASCAVASVLMLCGMAGMLDVGFWVLYAAGFALAAWVWVVRRDGPDWRLILGLVAYVAFLAWRFWGCWLSHNDDLSHWGLVARHLLEERALPDARAGIVKFQSYPLGGAAWIFYVCRTLGASREGLWLAAQYLWMGIAFLPVLSFIRANRYPLGILSAATFLFLMQRNPHFTTLQVDWLLAFLGIGGVAAMLPGEEPPRAVPALCAVICVAMVFVKSSGIFFAAVTALVMADNAGVKTRRRRVGYAALCAVCFIGAFVLWTVHVRLAYPAGLASKHAVSVGRWSGELREKGAQNILSIVGMMARSFFVPNTHAAAGWAYFLMCAALLFFGNRALAAGHYDRRAAMKGLLAAALVYVAWYVLLTLMYIFSMPIDEALRLASYPRYISTGLSYMMGLCLIRVLRTFGAPDVRLAVRRTKALYAALSVLVLALAAVMPRMSMWERLFHRDTQMIPLRARLAVAQQALDLPKGSRVLLCYDAAEYQDMNFTGVKYIAKYHFYTYDIDSVVSLERFPPETVEGVRWAYHVSDEKQAIDDPVETILAGLDRYDACVILDRMDDIDGPLRQRLSEYGGDAKVVYAYE